MKKGRDAKPHIGIFGRRNTGKSSFINRIASQDIAIVSNRPGTTTDPVKKSIEIFGVGPAILIDTAGIDDTGELGKKRKDKTIAVMQLIDMAILISCENIFGKSEFSLIQQFETYNIPYLIIHNKSDLECINESTRNYIREFSGKKVMDFCTVGEQDLSGLFDAIISTIPETVFRKRSLFAGVIKPGEHVLLVTPIDSEAPEGRMILPQVMAIRDILDNDCIAIVLKETELKNFIAGAGKEPCLVVTDSQAFSFVNSILPPHIPLTSFSIVLARAKSDFNSYMRGTAFISELKDNDKVLLLESCTHNVSCEDIGRHKLPKWIEEFTGKKLDFEVVPGYNPPKLPVAEYAMVIQCGGCVATSKQIVNRLRPAIEAGVPVSNYGLAIAYLNGIFNKVVEPFSGK